MRQVLALEVLFSLLSCAFAVVVHVPVTTPCPSYATARLRARHQSSSTFDSESALSVLSTALAPETSVYSLDDNYSDHKLSLDTLIEERSSAAWFTNLPYDVRTWADHFYRNQYVTGLGTTAPYDSESSSAPVYGGSGTVAFFTVTAEELSTSNTSPTTRFEVLATLSPSPSPSRPSLAASTAAPEPPFKPKSESRSKIIGITVGVVFSCVLVALLLFVVLRRRRRQRQGAASAPPADNLYETDVADAKVASRTAPLPAEVHREVYELPASDEGQEMSGSTGYHSPERPKQVYEAMAVEARGGNGGEAGKLKGS